MTSRSNFPPRLPSLAEPLCSHFDAWCTSLIVIRSADLVGWVFALRHFLVEQQRAWGVSLNRVACAIIAALTNQHTRRRSGNEQISAAHKTNL